MIEKVNNAGLECDNPKCDWVDTTIPDTEIQNWINVPCPKCGENLLTQEDYDTAIAFDHFVAYLNTLPEEEVLKIIKKMGMEDHLRGLEDLAKDKNVNLEVKIHEGIHTNIKISDK